MNKFYGFSTIRSRRLLELWSFVSVVDEERLQEGKHSGQSSLDENATIAILNVGRMNDGMEHEAECIDENVPILTLDLVACIVTMRINAGPPLFGAFHALAIDDGDGRTGFPLALLATSGFGEGYLPRELAQRPTLN